MSTLSVSVILCLNLLGLGIIKAQNSFPYSTWNPGIPVRRVLEYEFNVSWFTGAPNGVTKQILGVNGQFPGPTIRGTKGDFVRIRVTNKIQPHLNLSIHWHGMHQRESSFMDGVEQVSQCPLLYGQTQVYEFQLLQTGTHWWHSHYGPWLADGLWGLIIVDNEPEVWGHLYQDELIITLTDWFVKTGQGITDWYLGPENPERQIPFPHSILINGEGYYPCKYAELQGLKCVQKPRAPLVFEVAYGKTYRIRLMSASSGWNYKFSIENHTMTCIEADGTDTELSAPIDWLRLSLSFRYSFLVTMDAPGASVGSEFLIRGRSIGLADFENTSNINPYYYEDPNLLDAYAILRYVAPDKPRSAQPKQNTKSWTTDHETRVNVTGVQLDESLHCLALDNDLAPNYYDQEVQITFDEYHRKDGFQYWTTNGVQYEIVEGQSPAIFKAIWKESQPRYWNPIYTAGNGSVVQIVINNRPHFGHPVHLHGHSFWIVGAGADEDGDYIPSKHAHLLRTKVTKRDTTRVLGKSWLVLRYVADNPGVWFFHCHVNWHVPGGMAAVFIEGEDILRKRFKNVPKEAQEICEKAGIRRHDFGLTKSNYAKQSTTSNPRSSALIQLAMIWFSFGMYSTY